MAFTVIPAARHCLIPYRRGRLRFMLQTAQLLPPPWLSTLGFDPARFQTQPPACYRASWQLPGPDSLSRASRALPTPRVMGGWFASGGSGRWDETLVNSVDRVYEPLEAVGRPAGRPVRTEPMMTVARSVADVVSDHAIFDVESIDRMYLNV